MAMTAKDRQELRRILKARFDILHQQLHQREHDAGIRIREEITSQHSAAIAEANKKVAKLREKADKLEDEANTVLTEMKGKGLTNVRNGYHYANERYPIVSVSWQIDWTPAKLEEQVQEALNQLRNDAGYFKIDLNMKQLELEEKLAVGALESDDSKSFLAGIPTVDTLLPEATVTKVIEGAVAA